MQYDEWSSAFSSRLFHLDDVAGSSNKQIYSLSYLAGGIVPPIMYFISFMLVLVNRYIMSHLHGRMVEERTLLGSFYSVQWPEFVRRNGAAMGSMKVRNGVRKLLPNDSYNRLVTTRRMIAQAGDTTLIPTEQGLNDSLQELLNKPASVVAVHCSEDASLSRCFLSM